MSESIQSLLDELKATYSDSRKYLFDVQVEKLSNTTLTLGGRVLDDETLSTLEAKLKEHFPHLHMDAGAVHVLIRPNNPHLRVATNLTGLYETPSFSRALSSELLFGWDLEVLEERGRWVLTRQADGYLGWVYRPYLTENSVDEFTHVVVTASLAVRKTPDVFGEPVSRLMSGSGVTVLETQGEWARIRANVEGWAPLPPLRMIADLPRTEAERRKQIVKDAYRLIGIPYLWGGCTGNGIDCSGFMRLLHNWNGVQIPRDADMQYTDAKPIEDNFQPGDLFFFSESDSGRSITHVGMSLGGWNMIHSSRTRNGVYIDNVQETSLKEIFVSAGTFIGK